MYKTKKVGVVVPAYNEERFIGRVIDTMPSFVDRIFVVNDCSSDDTSSIVASRALGDSRVVLVDRASRGGVGAAVLAGHRRALREGIEVLAVMAGDGQMDPAFLADIVAPVAEELADYAKGNRLSDRKNRHEMPVGRLGGNMLLTVLTRLASGYYSMTDPQNGFTAISARALKKLDLDRIEMGFAFENDMLVKLNCIGATVMDVPHPAIYRGQTSKVRYGSFVVRTSWILLKDFFWRIWVKYVRRWPEKRQQVLPRLAASGRQK